jgi:hypothetical protein
MSWKGLPSPIIYLARVDYGWVGGHYHSTQAGRGKGASLGRNQVIMVNLTTQRPHSDGTTVLLPGEHPFIHRPTVVFYSDARQVSASLLDRSITQGVGHIHSAASPTLLQKLQGGLLVSALTPEKIKTAFRAAQAAGLTRPQ